MLMQKSNLPLTAFSSEDIRAGSEMTQLIPERTITLTQALWAPAGVPTLRLARWPRTCLSSASHRAVNI